MDVAIHLLREFLMPAREIRGGRSSFHHSTESSKIPTLMYIGQSMFSEFIGDSVYVFKDLVWRLEIGSFYLVRTGKEFILKFKFSNSGGIFSGGTVFVWTHFYGHFKRFWKSHVNRMFPNHYRRLFSQARDEHCPHKLSQTSLGTNRYPILHLFEMYALNFQ